MLSWLLSWWVIIPISLILILLAFVLYWAIRRKLALKQWLYRGSQSHLHFPQSTASDLIITAREADRPYPGDPDKPPSPP